MFSLYIDGGLLVEKAKTIQHELKQFLIEESMNITELSIATDINRGILSGVINGNPPKVLSIKMLDTLTEYMKLPEGYYYHIYIEDCFREGAHGRRLRPFLLRCAAIGRTDCVEDIVNRLADDLKQIGFIFDVGEEMYQLVYYEAAAVMYKCVVQTEKSNQSERLGISYYRLFQMNRSDNKLGVKSAMQFIPYRHRIPEHLALNGLLMLTHFFAVREELEEVEKYADELYSLSHAIYENKSWKVESFITERPFVYYYGQSYLLKATYYELTENYEESRKWITGYSDLSWLDDLDDDGKKEVKKFSFFAKANLLSIDVKTGNKDVLSEYVKLLRENESEIIKGITALLESANKYKYYIDNTLSSFSDYLEDKTTHVGMTGHYKKEFQILDYSNLNQKYAIYCFRKKEYSRGIAKLLDSMQDAVQIQSKESISKSMGLFEVFRAFASSKQIQQFNNICRKECKNEAETYGLDFNIFIY